MVTADELEEFNRGKARVDAAVALAGHKQLEERVARLEGWVIAGIFQGFITLAGGAMYALSHH